jgi:metallophosphoesterase superfamily enzyme
MCWTCFCTVVSVTHSPRAMPAHEHVVVGHYHPAATVARFAGPLVDSAN